MRQPRHNCGCFLAVLPIVIGFILGGLFCFIICLLSGCHSNKKIVESVSVDSVVQTTETETTFVNKDFSSLSNLSLQFDSLEILAFPSLALAAGAPGDSLGVPPSGAFNISNYFPSMLNQAPIYLRASRASLASERAEQSTVDSTTVKEKEASSDLRSRSDRSEDVDTTAVAKPPDMNWIIIAILTGIIILLLITNFTKKK